jgi:hypothetical protein
MKALRAASKWYYPWPREIEGKNKILCHVITRG